MMSFFSRFIKELNNLPTSDAEKNTSYQKRERLVDFNKYLTNPAFLAGFFALFLLVLVMFFNAVINILTSLFSGGEFPGFFSACFGFHAGLWPGYLICIIIALVGFIRFYAGFYLAYRSLDVGQKGTSRWTSRDELAEQYRLVPEKTYSFPGGGGVPIARTETGIYIDDSPVNNLIIGISRSGKGELVVFPEIDIYSRAEKKASLVINDPKLELCAATMDKLKERGYEVHVLNLVDPIMSMGYNPLTAIVDEYKTGNEAGAEELCAALCYSIFNSAADTAGDGKFWADNSTALLSALILASCEDNLKADEIENARRKSNVDAENQARKLAAIKALSEEERKKYYISIEIQQILAENPEASDEAISETILGSSLQNCISLVQELRKSPVDVNYEKLIFTPTNDNEKKINMYSIINTFSMLSSTKYNSAKNMLDIYFESRPEGDRARLKYATIGTAGDKTKGSIYSNTLSRLQVFTYENIAKMTAKSSVDMLSVGFGDKPVAIFLGLPDYDRSNWFIATVFIRQLYYTLAKAATHTPSGKCKNEVVFILDEFGNMPPIDDMSNIITVCLGRNIRFNLVIQDFAQISNLYGDNAATIRSNCANQIYIMTNDKDTAEAYSNLLGNETYTNINRSGKRFSLDKEYIENQEERPLLNSNELMNLQEGEMIVTRVIKRRDLRKKSIIPHPIASMGEYRMKYRYEYLLDDFPNRTLSEITDIEMIDKINLSAITWSCETYLKRFKVFNKNIADTEVKMGDDYITVPGVMTLSERESLKTVLGFSGKALATYNEMIETQLTLGMLHQIAMRLYTENLQKSIVLLNMIDTVLRREHVAVPDLTVKTSNSLQYISGAFYQMTQEGQV